MPLIRADRVKESSTSTSTGAFLLNGADSTYRTFASVCAVGDTVYYAIAHRSASEWEVGLGTYSAVNTLTRTTVHASSNANAAVAFSAGTKDVLLALTKAQLETYATLAGTETLTNKTISGANNTITNVSLTTGVTGTLPIANGGTGTTTAQLAINALAGAVASGSYLRGNGTNVVMAAIQAADVPTLNQNTTGTASGSVSGTASYLAKFTSTNVVGNSQIYDNGTNVGIGTASPTGYKFVVRTTGTSAISVISAGSNTPGPTMDWYDSTNTTEAVLACASGQVNFGAYSNHPLVLLQNATERMRLHTGGTVGINETAPGAQLHVTTAAAATKGLIVKGASAQSANLLELQNSSGTVLASVDPSGIAVFGAQTGAQNGYTIRAWSTPANTSNGQILTSLTGASGGNERYRMSIGNTSSYGFLQTYENAIGYTMSLALQPSGGSVGIGTTSPSDKLHVIGNVRAGSYTNGYLAMTGDLPGYSAGVYPTLKSDSTIFFSANGYYTAYLGDGSNRFALLNTSAQEKARLDPQGTSYFTGGAVAFGATTAAGGGQVYVAPQAAATKGLVVRGASAQSANLQEWQNSAGTALAAVNSAGALVPYAGIYTPVANGFVSELYITQQVSEYTQSFYRTLPSVVGDYVELIEVGDTNSVRYEFSISVVNYPYWILKRYDFTTTWNNATNGVVPPVSISNRNYALDYDFELETVSVSSYYRRFRIKRTKGTTTNVQAMVLMRSFGDYATHNRTELTGTGTSAYSSYITRSYDYVNPNIAAPPPANYSGNGTPLSLYASSALTTGSGGGITLQAGNAATTGSGGSITLYTGAGAGGGVGGLIQSRSQADSYNRSSKFILVRSIPDTVGNYVELGRIGWLAGTVQKVSVYASRGAYDGTNQTYNTLGKEYEFSAHYYTSGTVAPRTISGNTGGGRQPNEFELEMAWNANGYQVLRLRRSKADATNFSGYTATVVIEQSIWSPHAMEFVELSGTGTSALTNAYLTNTGTYCYPALIPPPTGGTSGAGTDLAIYGGNAIGTGAGGSILLQAGAFATSGSNGKVIVRGLASNTANLQEWQNNAGAVLASIEFTGRLVSTSALILNQSPSVPTLSVRSGNPSTTNIQQWENYYGGLLSYVDANGNIYAPTVSAGTLSTTQWFAGSSYVFSRIFLRNGNLPNVVGDYVELFQCTNSRALPIRIAINANGPSQGKVYDFVFGSAYYGGAGTGSIIPPLHSAGADSANDFELEVYHVDTNWSRFRLRRTAGTSNRAFQAYINIQVGNTGGDVTVAGGTGTSTIGSSENPGYGINTHNIAPIHASTYSGTGRNLTLSGANGQGTGAGGSVILQPGAQATSGGDGTVISRRGANGVSNIHHFQASTNTYAFFDYSGRLCITPEVSTTVMPVDCGLFVTPRNNANTIGVVVRGVSGQAGNLQQWQNNAGTVLAHVSSAGAGKLTTSLSIENASIPGKNATLTVSPVVSGSTTDLTVGGDLYRIFLQAADNVMFSTSLGTDTGAYPRFNGSGLRLASGALTFRTGQTWQGSDDVGITWGASGTMRVSNASTGGGSFAFTSNSPAAFTADQNDLVLNGSAFQRLSGTAARNITGIAPPSGSHVDGRMIRLYNVGSFNLTLKHNSASSTAANRFYNVQAIDIIVGANDYAELIYDGTNNGSGAAGWRVA